MSAYLTASEFALLTVMPAEFLDEIEDRTPGWIDAQLETQSRWVDARLSKRYAVPFAAPVPEVVRSWVTRLVTLRAYHRRGVDPSDQQIAEVAKDRDDALLEIKEAADAEIGLIDLPLRADTTASGISKTSTLAYTERSPYVGLDVQRTAGRDEDMNGGGSYV